MTARRCSLLKYQSFEVHILQLFITANYQNRNLPMWLCYNDHEGEDHGNSALPRQQTA